jgi:hypothetical protein
MRHSRATNGNKLKRLRGCAFVRLEGASEPRSMPERLVKQACGAVRTMRE